MVDIQIDLAGYGPILLENKPWASPFPKGDHACVAVKLIDPRGNEVMRLHRLYAVAAQVEVVEPSWRIARRPIDARVENMAGRAQFNRTIQHPALRRDPKSSCPPCTKEGEFLAGPRS